jgi:hypothetical protein
MSQAETSLSHTYYSQMRDEAIATEPLRTIVACHFRRRKIRSLMMNVCHNIMKETE